MTTPFSLKRALSVWQRNFLVWRKLAIPSMLGNLADPMIYLFGLGYGLGSMLPSVGGLTYISFLATGMVCSSTMQSASFEALYSAFARLQMQKTWDAILNAPVSVADIVAGEWLWAASKATLSGSAILLVICSLGFCQVSQVVLVIPLLFLIGLCFAGLGLIMTSLSPSFDFFMYYFTLFITPMVLISGIFFPTSQLPTALQWLTQALPLTHAVALIRPLLLGQTPANWGLHIGVLAVLAFGAFMIARHLATRRLMK